MEKEKEIVRWLKKNNQVDNSFSDTEYKKGLSLFCKNSKNRVLIHNLSSKKIMPRHKALLHYNLTKILRRQIEINNAIANSVVNGSTCESEVTKTSVKKTTEKKKINNTAPKVTTIRAALMPDSLVKLQAKSGQLFAKSAVKHRELADKYFLRDDNISEDERKEIEPIVVEIVADSNENISIHQELEYYDKTGQILGHHPDLINVDYSVLSDAELYKKIKTAMSNISSYSTSLKTANAEKKVNIALKIKELQKKKETLVAERDRRKNVI